MLNPFEFAEHWQERVAFNEASCADTIVSAPNILLGTDETYSSFGEVVFVTAELKK